MATALIITEMLYPIHFPKSLTNFLLPNLKKLLKDLGNYAKLDKTDNSIDKIEKQKQPCQFNLDTVAFIYVV